MKKIIRNLNKKKIIIEKTNFNIQILIYKIQMKLYTESIQYILDSLSQEYEQKRHQILYINIANNELVALLLSN